MYCSLVRSSHKFGTVLWNIYQSYLINKLEKIQRNCLRFNANKTMFLYWNTDEIPIAVGLNSLKTKQTVFGITFVYKILNGDIDCPELLHKIGIKETLFNSRRNSPFALYLIKKINMSLIVCCVAHQQCAIK